MFCGLDNVLVEHSSDTLDEDGDDEEDQIILREWWLSNNYICK